MLGNDEKLREFVQLQKRMYGDFKEVFIPEILSYPTRPQSNCVKTREIEKLQRDGLMILESVITEYPGWEPGYALFKGWDQKATTALKKLRTSQDKVKDYLDYRITDEKASASSDTEGLKDLFTLFYIQLHRLEKIRLSMLGHSDISELRGKALYDTLKKTGMTEFKSMEDFIALHKYEKNLYENKKQKPVKKKQSVSKGPKFRIEKKEGRIWIDHKAILINPKAKYFEALLFIKEKAPDEKKAIRASRILEHVESKAKRLEYLFRSQQKLWKLLLKNDKKLYYWNNEYTENK